MEGASPGQKVDTGIGKRAFLTEGSLNIGVGMKEFLRAFGDVRLAAGLTAGWWGTT
jgi:hypothetical protein